MMTLTCKQLRQLIATALSFGIDDLRAGKEHQFFYEFDVLPTDAEIDEFILSSDCIDEEVKDWLVGESEEIMSIKIFDDTS